MGRILELIFRIKGNYFLVDIITLFKKKKLLIKSIPIKSKIISNRKSRVGNEVFVNFKILRCLRLLV